MRIALRCCERSSRSTISPAHLPHPFRTGTLNSRRTARKGQCLSNKPGLRAFVTFFPQDARPKRPLPCAACKCVSLSLCSSGGVSLFLRRLLSVFSLSEYHRGKKVAFFSWRVRGLDHTLVPIARKRIECTWLKGTLILEEDGAHRTDGWRSEEERIHSLD